MDSERRGGPGSGAASTCVHVSVSRSAWLVVKCPADFNSRFLSLLCRGLHVTTERCFRFRWCSFVVMMGLSRLCPKCVYWLYWYIIPGEHIGLSAGYHVQKVQKVLIACTPFSFFSFFFFSYVCVSLSYPAWLILDCHVDFNSR